MDEGSRIRWEDIIKFAVGELELTRWEFLQLRWDEYSYKCEGYFKKEERAWEKARWITYCSLVGNPNIKGGSKPSTFQAYLNRFKPRKEPTKQDLIDREEKLRKIDVIAKRIFAKQGKEW